jgi:hypothetical protein
MNEKVKFWLLLALLLASLLLAWYLNTGYSRALFG